jgi:hypothetical protein
MAEAEWVACERAGVPWVMVTLQPGVCSNAGGYKEVRPCRVGAGGQVSREVCASCPVPKMAAALEGITGRSDGSECPCPMCEAAREALALYRKGGR